MKKIFLLLLLLPFVLGGKAQEDSLQTNRYVMRATLYGKINEIQYEKLFV